MRKLLFLLVIMMAVGGVLGLLMRQDSGYVLVAYNGITIETSLWVLVALLIITLFVLSWVTRLLFRTLQHCSTLATVTRKLAHYRDHPHTIQCKL